MPYLWLLSLLFCAAANAEPPALKTPEGAFDVYEWVIFICDPAQPQANSSLLYPSTLPDFANSRRTAAPVEKAGEPQPVGVIRFQGSSGKDTADVQITNKGGKFLAMWPKAQTRTNALLWQNLKVTESAGASLEQLGANSWLNTLRSATGAAFLQKENHAEPFLLYDAETGYKLPLRVVAGSGRDKYLLSNTDKIPLHDLSFYKQEEDGWHTAALAEFTTTAATQPAASQPKPSTTKTAATAPATTRLAATAPSTTQAAGLPIALSPANIKDDVQILAPWKQKLATAGLPATDMDLILSILQHHALDGKRLTAVYRLDADQMETLLPLEVTPQPRKTVRVGIVIVRNIDPDILHEVEDLITQLGDNNWAKREAAHESLKKLGAAARPKLEAMLKTAKDPEITYRVEQLLAALTTPPPPPPNGG